MHRGVLALLLLLVFMTWLQGCASGVIVIDASPEVPVEAYAAAHDRQICHDRWPTLQIDAAESMPAEQHGRWPGQYAARRMMQESLERVTARSRCRDATDYDLTLVLEPRRLYFGDSQVSTFVFQPRVSFDLGVTVMAEHMRPVDHWFIKLRVYWPYEPFRGSGWSIDSRHKQKESEYAYLTHEAMIFAIELALECLREKDGKPALRPFMIDPDHLQCLPHGASRQPQTVNRSYFKARFGMD